MPRERASSLSSIPSVESLLSDQDLLRRVPDISRPVLADCIREVLESHRSSLVSGTADRSPGRAALVEEIAAHAAAFVRGSLVRVVNATGVLLHTNLGRSILSPAAVEAVRMAMQAYVNLEMDLDENLRTRRDVHYVGLLRRLTGAEDALVVNNNAAAVFLCLATLARDREVIVSRGELIEIGGSFRLPDVMVHSGTRLVEVGTTNKTYVGDFAAAVGPETAALLKAHTSNYRIEGFVAQPALEELVELGRERGIPVVFDAGSGLLAKAGEPGFDQEPLIGAAVAAGADLVTFSGDKLLGGPQAGIIVGRGDLVDRLRKSPLHRALRLDKLSLAALAATLREHIDPERARERIPALRMLFEPAASLRRRAESLAAVCASACGGRALVDCMDGESEAGGGTLPMVRMPTTLVRVRPTGGAASRVERSLRRGEPPILCMIRDEAILFDPRTLLPGDAETVAARLGEVLA
jgi:L-seryl-tRNA(Ser) seleniumtransferase